MTLITCKKGVVFAGFSPALVRILLALVKVAERYDVMITSASDGEHLQTSRHYSLEAVDVRTKQFTAAQKAGLVSAVQRELGEAFTVLLEDEGQPNEHLHVQPRRGTNYTLAQLRAV